jgi:branched-chain amino acid transport system substrate-binding protein
LDNFKFQISNFKSQSSNLKSQISDFKFRIPALLFLAPRRSQISNLKLARPHLAALRRPQISKLKLQFLTLPRAGALFAALLFSSSPALPQTPPQPYAVIPRDAVNYSGPDRDASHNLPGSEIKIGLLAPLTGSRQNEGRALLQAAKLAIEDEAATPFPGGRRLSIVARDQSDSWGRATNEIVHLVFDDQAAALVTSLDGDSAHLAEQVGNKVGIPVVTLSTDPSTTQTNLPWIFRLAPTDTQQARAFARDIYLERKLKRVVLVTDSNHDGRVGGEEFQKAAHALSAPLAGQLEVEPTGSNLDSMVSQTMAANPEALVFWTGPETASRLLAPLLKAFPTTQFYLSQEAAQTLSSTLRDNVWILASSLAENPLRKSFENRYRARTGEFPLPAAAQAYDAVRILAASLRRSGPNRARLRDALAALSNYQGVSGAVAFDHAGNDLSDFTLVRFPSAESTSQ